ncbi:DNA polymerase III subunit epsilon [Acetobacteraceae bacterium H6797]|nr:DNA polymerase III subunit epsilon [Acetobacteraceae bacterium H6797]
MTRALVFDTETTGLEPFKGDRVIEIAAIELVNLMPTGEKYHVLIDPERDIPEEATRVHGMTREMLAGKPKFAEVIKGFLDFIGNDPLIAHNAPFDFGFMDAEFDRCGVPRLPRSRMIDTLELAKKRFPGLPNSLDALCRRFGIDNSMRTSHNALLDVLLLGQVYLELMGGRQPGLMLAANAGGGASNGPVIATVQGLTRPRTPRPIVPSAAELEAHAAFLKKIKEPLWETLEKPADSELAPAATA